MTPEEKQSKIGNLEAEYLRLSQHYNLHHKYFPNSFMTRDIKIKMDRIAFELNQLKEGKDAVSEPTL